MFEGANVLSSIVDQQFNTPVFLSAFIGGVYYKRLSTTETESLYEIDINTIFNQVFRHNICSSFGQD